MVKVQVNGREVEVPVGIFWEILVRALYAGGREPDGVDLWAHQLLELLREEEEKA